MECKEKGKEIHYVGETHRSFWDRAREHQKALSDRDNKYAVSKHWEISHPELEVPPQFKYKVINQPRYSLHRQIQEALEIGSREEGTLLNSKTEWGQNPLPRISTTFLETVEEISTPPKWQEKTTYQKRARDQLEDEMPKASNPSAFFQNQLKQRKRRRRMANTEEVQEVPDPPDGPPEGEEGEGQPPDHEQGQSNTRADSGSRSKEMTMVQVAEWMAKANERQAELERTRREKLKQKIANTKKKPG